MSKFYKRDPAAWMDATNDMSLELEAALSRIVDATALYDRPPSARATVLAGLWRCNERKAKRLLKELIATGYAHEEDGRIILLESLHQ